MLEFREKQKQKNKQKKVYNPLMIQSSEITEYIKCNGIKKKTFA